MPPANSSPDGEPARALRILLIEDNPADARLLREHLRLQSDEMDVDQADALAAGLDRLLANTEFDAILLDLHLPDSEGLETFDAVHAAVPDVAVVILTGYEDMRLAEEAVRRGAQDYLVKGRVGDTVLLQAIRYAVHRQRKLTEIERAKQSEIEEKNRFLSHVSHELRTPLAVVHEFLSLVLDGVTGELRAEQSDCLGIALRNAVELRILIDDMLEATRIDGNRVRLLARPTSLAQAVELCRQDLLLSCLDKGLTLRAEVGDDLPLVQADPHRLRQVLTNLVGNSIKFTPHGGRIAIGARTAPNAREVEAWVTDTGSGIREGNLESVFDRFFQEEPAHDLGSAGLGLGLFVCREIVARHGGRLWVRNNRSGGCTFTFTMPLPTGSSAAVRDHRTGRPA